MVKGEVIGIDIGKKNIKLATVRGGRVFKINHLHILPTPEGTISQDGMLQDLEGLSKVLSEHFGGNKKKKPVVSFCMGSSSAIVREFTVPIMGDKEVRAAVEFQLSQRFPGIGHTHALSIKTIRKSESEIFGIVAFCPNRVIESYMNLAEMAGLDVRYLDIHPNCMAKSYKHFNVNAKEYQTALLIDLGYQSSQISLIHRQNVILNRYVDGGGNAIDRLVSGNFSVDMETAEQIKLGKDPKIVLDQREHESFLRLGLISVEEQIRHMLEFYNYGKYDDVIKHIVLCGGTSKISGIEKYLSDTIQIPTLVAKGNTNSFEVDRDYVLYMAAIGAAIRED